MEIVLILSVCVAWVSCDFAPIYSPSYANVYYQRAAPPRYGVKFNLPAKQQEATTPMNDIVTNFDELNPTLDPDTTTDPNSERVYHTRKTEPPPTKYSEQLELTEELEPAEEPEQVEEPTLNHREVYYIYHPNGLLQKVVFESRDDPEHMEYFGQVNYHDIPPVVEPVYTYDPDHLIFRQLNVI